MKSDIVIGKKIIHIFYTKTTSEQKKIHQLNILQS